MLKDETLKEGMPRTIPSSLSLSLFFFFFEESGHVSKFSFEVYPQVSSWSI